MREEEGEKRREYKYGYPSTDKYRMNEKGNIRGRRGEEWMERKREERGEKREEYSIIYNSISII